MIKYITSITFKYSWFLFSLGAALIVYFCAVLRLFNLSNGILYDTFIKLSPEIRKTPSAVIIIDTPYERKDAGDEVWLSLLNKVEALEPRNVIFNFLPQNASQEFYSKAQSLGNVIFGRRVIEDLEEPGRFILEPVKDELLKLNIVTGVVDIPPANHGIHRYQYLNLIIEGKSYASLEKTAAEAVINREDLPRGDSFLVNFIGKPNLPRVSLDRVLSGGLVPEIVKDRSVVIGLFTSSADSGFYTPLTSGDRKSSLLEFQGHALNTLILNKAVKEVHPFGTFVIILVISMSMLILYNLLNIKGSIWATVMIPVISLPVLWLIFTYMFIWLPAFEILLAQVVIGILILREKSLLSEQSANLMLLDLSVKIRQRAMPESFYTSRDYWSQVITMVDQILHLNRSIFLEKVEGDHRVREVKALNCSLSDIQERRRDYERPPYSDAVKESGPINLGTRLFFKEVPATEEQHLVPLVFGGKIIGFWVFGIDPETVSSIPMFNNVIRNFADQISELLYERQQWTKSEQEKGKSYSPLSYDFQHYELRQSIDLLERRLILLESVFSGIDSAVILYDIFGRVLQINQKMSKILSMQNLAPFNMTALDLAVAISGLEREKIRQQLYQVILDKKTITLPVLFTEKGESFTLNIKPLTQGSTDLREVRSFDIYGILFEIVDVSKFKHINRFPDQPVLETKVSGTIYSTNNISEILNGFKDNLLHRNIKVNIKPAENHSFHLAGKQSNINDIFKSILEILIKDAEEESIISVEIKEDPETITYRFSNSGFGMPDKTFQQYLVSEGSAVSQELVRLKSAIEELKNWNGQVEAYSEVGKGTMFTVYIKRS